jgi:hypothetical protein
LNLDPFLSSPCGVVFTKFSTSIADIVGPMVLFGSSTINLKESDPAIYRGRKTMIGKRKRETRRITRTDQTSSSTTLGSPDLNIFKKYFETRFEPLQGETTKEVGSPRTSDDLDTSSDAASLSDWDGLSSGEPIPPVEVVEHGKESIDLVDQVQQAKAFMVCLVQ